MKGTRVDRIVEEWSTVASRARRPDAAPRGVMIRSGLPGATLTGAAVVIAAVVIAAILIGRPGPGVIAGSSPSATANSTESATASLSSKPTEAATSSPPATASATATPVERCDPANLSARITLWEGAAGQRIGHVELKNVGKAACRLETLARPQLVDGRRAVIIDGTTPAAPGLLTVAPGAVVVTLVAAGNDCRPAPIPPVSIAFVLSDGRRLVAAPVGPADATVPPCLGGPGSAGTIDMHSWAP